MSSHAHLRHVCPSANGSPPKVVPRVTLQPGAAWGRVGMDMHGNWVRCPGHAHAHAGMAEPIPGLAGLKRIFSWNGLNDTSTRILHSHTTPASDVSNSTISPGIQATLRVTRCQHLQGCKLPYNSHLAPGSAKHHVKEAKSRKACAIHCVVAATSHG